MTLHAARKRARQLAQARSPFLHALLALIILATGVAWAGTGWLSGTASPPSAAKDDDEGGGPVMVDLVVALYDKEGEPGYPAGDDDGNTQGAAGSEEQDNYEEVFQYLADAVFEATEGTHLLRDVRIFRHGGRIPGADIVWDETGVVDSTRNGIDAPGGHIWMYDIFSPGGTFPDIDLLANTAARQGAGYLLAHELGHYLYGAGDEYKILEGDIPVAKSIMNSPWRAVPAVGEAATDEENGWLNFSVRWQGDPAGDFEDTRHTDQHRLYQESVWETIARNPDSDPKLADLNATFARKHFPELAEAAPEDDEKPRIDLPSEAARSALNIRWLSNEVVYEIILDRSGSMGQESKLVHAKLAAQNLVAQAALYDTKIGVVAFDRRVEVLAPIRDIDGQDDIDSLNAILETMTPGSGTPIGDGAQLGLDELIGLDAEDDTKVAFLLSDGKNNRGVDPLSVIPGYKAARIPLFVFAYGSSAHIYTLGTMAAETGGEMFISPSQLSEVSQAFVRANRVAQGCVLRKNSYEVQSLNLRARLRRMCSCSKSSHHACFSS